MNTPDVTKAMQERMGEPHLHCSAAGILMANSQGPDASIYNLEMARQKPSPLVVVQNVCA